MTSNKKKRRFPIIAAAALFAAAELLFTIIAGHFFDWGRAELLLFHIYRPWLLLIASALVAPQAWRKRYLFYGAALAFAALSETLLVLMLGSSSPFEEAFRGFIAGALVAAVIDLGLQVGRWIAGRVGLFLSIIGLIAAAAFGALRPYEAILTEDPEAAISANRLAVVLMTGLPIIWGEKGAFDPGSRPSESYRQLQREFQLKPIDYIDQPFLAGERLLLLMQPRLPAPAELVAVDQWIRNGGRALILADPVLVWPSELAIGDVRRPPPNSLLRPLLRHWGLELLPHRKDGTVVQYLTSGGERRKLTMFAPGVLRGDQSCALKLRGSLADCRIGRGRVIILADADLLHDRMWMPPIPKGWERHARIADNAVIIADLLDVLADQPRERLAGNVVWIAGAADRRLALIIAFLPLAVALLAAAIVYRLGRR